jgi:hypothetical protein
VKRLLEKIGLRLHGKIGYLFSVVIIFVIFLFSILLLLFKLPLSLWIKGETDKNLHFVSISFRLFLSFFKDLFKATHAPKCIGCGITDFIDKRGKDGYSISWKKYDRKTGKAICTDCESNVDFIE